MKSELLWKKTRCRRQGRQADEVDPAGRGSQVSGGVSGVTDEEEHKRYGVEREAGRRLRRLSVPHELPQAQEPASPGPGRRSRLVHPELVRLKSSVREGCGTQQWVRSLRGGRLSVSHELFEGSPSLAHDMFVCGHVRVQAGVGALEMIQTGP